MAEYNPSRGYVPFRFDDDGDQYVMRFNWRAIANIEDDLDIDFYRIYDLDTGELNIRLGDLARVIYYAIEQQADDLEMDDVYEMMDMQNFDRVQKAFAEAFAMSNAPDEAVEQRESEVGKLSGSETTPS